MQCRTTKLRSQKRRHLAVFCISFYWQRGTRLEKRRDYYLPLAIFCINRTANKCYDFSRIIFQNWFQPTVQSLSWLMFSSGRTTTLISSCCLGKTRGSSIYDVTIFFLLFEPFRRPGRKGLHGSKDLYSNLIITPTTLTITFLKVPLCWLLPHFYFSCNKITTT